MCLRVVTKDNLRTPILFVPSRCQKSSLQGRGARDGRLDVNHSSNKPVTTKSIAQQCSGLDYTYEEEPLRRNSCRSFTDLQISHNADNCLSSGNSQQVENLGPHNPGKPTLPNRLRSLHDPRLRPTRTNSVDNSSVRGGSSRNRDNETFAIRSRPLQKQHRQNNPNSSAVACSHGR